MKYKYRLSLAVAVLISVSAMAQIRISSPYSRYALGDLYSQAGLRNQAMGGSVIADNSSQFINFRNPSSYAYIDSMSFLFDGAIRSHSSTLSTSSQSQKSNYSSLEYIAISFPLAKRLGASFGLIPYSHVGYKISTYDNSSLYGNTKFTSEGSGGISSFYGGLGFSPYSWISVGFNASYLFGTINKVRWYSFPDSINYFNISNRNSTRINDFLFTGGLMLTPKIGKYSLNLGFTASLPSDLSIKSDTFTFTYLQTSGASQIMDTLTNVIDKTGEQYLPLSIGVGVRFSEGQKWMIGADANWQKWSEYTSFGMRDSLVNSYRISLGGEFTPNNIEYRLSSNYLRRITFRAGVNYGKSFLEYKGESLPEYGISFGVGLPLRGTLNRLNLTAAYSSRGSHEDGLLKQELYQLSVGVSVHEKWFLKRKID